FWPYGTISATQDVWAVGMMVVAIFPLAGWASGLYISRRSQSVASELFDVVKVTLITLLVLVTVTYFVREVRFSRGTLIAWMGLTVSTVGFARVVSRLTLRYLRSRGFNLRHVVLVGAGPFAARVMDTIKQQGGLGLRVHGV